MSHRFSQSFTPTAIPFFISACDEGVRRNGGRAGARLGPACILSAYAQFIAHDHSPLQYQHVHLAQATAESDLQQSHLLNAQDMFLALLEIQPRPFVHLGGGHDHVYTLLRAIGGLGFEKITVLNIDAHCDTRIDPSLHSGNPFRLLDQEIELDLIQYGIHPFANDAETLGPLKNGSMTIFPMDELVSTTKHFSQIPSRLLGLIKPDQPLLLSLDCDALEASVMEGVSAVNPRGFPLSHVYDLIKHFAPQALALGIYEYNPLYDSLNAKGAKTMAALIDYFLAHTQFQTRLQWV